MGHVSGMSIIHSRNSQNVTNDNRKLTSDSWWRDEPWRAFRP